MKGMLLTLVGGAALVAAACSSGGDGSGLTQSTRVDGVNVEATWLDAAGALQLRPGLSTYPLSTMVVIELKLDTNTGDVSKIDMGQAASLKQTESGVSPQAWVPLKDDPRHRDGMLLFPRVLQDGPVTLSVDFGDTKAELTWETHP